MLKTLWNLTKASDCVNYRVLVIRLSYYGLDGNTGQQFDLFLTNRRQGVKMKLHTRQIDQFCSVWDTAQHKLHTRLETWSPLYYYVY
jgi:hypothetical protein